MPVFHASGNSHRRDPTPLNRRGANADVKFPDPPRRRKWSPRKLQIKHVPTYANPPRADRYFTATFLECWSPHPVGIHVRRVQSSKTRGVALLPMGPFPCCALGIMRLNRQYLSFGWQTPSFLTFGWRTPHRNLSQVHHPDFH